MHGGRQRCGIALAVSLATGVACAADVSAVPTSGTDAVTDEVVVNGARLRGLRAAVLQAEDRFLARYNELNQDHDLDIQCLQFTPTGTHFSYRYCLTRLQKKAQQKDGDEFLTYMRNSDVQNGAAPPIPETGVRLMERSQDYRKNLIKLLRDHPELRELLVARGDAERLYEAERKKR